MEKELICQVLNRSDMSNRQKVMAIYGTNVSRQRAFDIIKRLELNSLREAVSGEVIAEDPFMKYKVISKTTSSWDQSSKRGDKVLHASKVTVKPVFDFDSMFKYVDEFTANRLGEGFVDESPQKEAVFNKAKLIEIPITDLHIGLCTFSGETAEDFKSNDMKGLISKYMDVVCANLKREGVSKNTDIVISFLGDLVNYDNKLFTTTAGTLQDSDNSFFQTYNLALELLDMIIGRIYNMLSANSKLHIIYVPGNHDEVIGYTLISAMRIIYNKENITFDYTSRSRKFFKYGCNLIGFTHGKIDKAKMGQWLYSEAREYISSSKNIEVHAGHMHSQQTVEDNGVIVRHIPTIKPNSTWEYNKGYSSKKTLPYFVWDKELGLEKITFNNIY